MRAHRLLLRLLPASFRNEHGAEMTTLFARRLAHAGGTGARAALWARELAGVAASALSLHADLLAQDARWSLRALRRSPGFAASVIAVSALGIGATTATFSVADHVFVRRLPFAEPDRLVKLWENEVFRGYPRLEPSPANLRAWSERTRSLSSIASYWATSRTMVGEGAPMRLDAAQVSASLGPTLGVEARLGRLFTPEDDRPGAPATVVLAHAFWSARFAGDREIVGRTVELDGERATVIGVLPPGLHFPTRATQIWTPHRFEPSWFEDRDNNFLRVVARLAPGASLESATAELDTIAAALDREQPTEGGSPGIALVRLRDELGRDSRLLLTALAAASGCLLLLACTNLASLLLARSLARRKELAVRAALGGGRARLVRQMLTESLLLAAAGGALGLALAFLVTPAIAELVPSGLPIGARPPVDLRLVALATLLTVGTGIGFGLFPALRTPVDASAAELREGARSGVGGRRERSRKLLVGVEVALSVAILISTGLLLRALTRLQATDPGFRSDGVVTLRTWLPRPEYVETGKRHRFHSEVLERVNALPGVSAAGYSSFLPIVMRGGIWSLTVAGDEKGSDSRSASLRFVTSGFLGALGVPLESGRMVADSDTLESEKVAVVSASFVREHLGGRDPIGQRFEIAFFERTIVGVVGDVAVRGLGKSSEPQVYLPHRQIPDGWMPFYDAKDLAVRHTAPLEQIVPELRRIVASADPKLPITDIRTLADVVAGDTAPRTAQLRILGAFAGVALLLTALGLQGLLASQVAARRQEIGVRVALGATRRQVVALVGGEAALPAAIGLAAGLALAAFVGRALTLLLYGVGPFDPATWAAAVALVLLTSLFGALLPTLRALAVDPVEALRAE